MSFKGERNYIQSREVNTGENIHRGGDEEEVEQDTQKLQQDKIL